MAWGMLEGLWEGEGKGMEGAVLEKGQIEIDAVD